MTRQSATKIGTRDLTSRSSGELLMIPPGSSQPGTGERGAVPVGLDCSPEATSRMMSHNMGINWLRAGASAMPLPFHDQPSAAAAVLCVTNRGRLSSRPSGTGFGCRGMIQPESTSAAQLIRPPHKRLFCRPETEVSAVHDPDRGRPVYIGGNNKIHAWERNSWACSSINSSMVSPVKRRAHGNSAGRAPADPFPQSLAGQALGPDSRQEESCAPASTTPASSGNRRSRRSRLRCRRPPHPLPRHPLARHPPPRHRN